MASTKLSAPMPNLQEEKRRRKEKRRRLKEQGVPWYRRLFAR